ncbi:protein mono-ADP-ribosyltransferase PARP14-like [Bufo bufo]|uniref:protein mono-ADP-ribosyltransferase PARP14-like n=1 Tax=Bufo bufo TaxID=8384 RepID=UPI001ABDF5BD|nr:protein mono-ADP-ribosyltransferase PARP14-like [Bufo bufo]
MSYYDLCKTNMNNMDKISYSIAVKSSKELSEKQEKELKHYFSLRKKSNGGECEVNKLGPSLYRVSYQKKEVKERVLNHKDHRIESEGELIQFTVQEEEENDQTNVHSQEMSGNVGSLTESSRPSENTELKEMKSFILLDSNFQYKVAKDKIDALCQYFPSLKVCCENRELILSGNLSDIRSAREEIKNILHLVKVRKIQVSKAITDFLIFRDSKEMSEKLFGDLSEGMVILDIPRGFFLYAFSINLLDDAEVVLQKRLLHGSINIKVNEKDIVSSEPWKSLWDKLIGNADIKMSFHSNEDNGNLILSIVGFTEEVKKALKECEDLLHCRKIVNKDIYLDPHAGILIENRKELLEWFNLGQLSAAVQISRTKDQTMTLTGTHEEVEKSKFVLQKLMQKHVDSFCINKYGATHYFNNQGKTLLDDVQKKYDCRVFIRDSENKKNNAEVIEKTKDGSANLVDKGFNKKEVKREDSRDKGTHKDRASSSNQKTENPLKKTTPTLQLVLSFGNLENKKANAIVAPLLSNNPVLEAMNVTKGLKKKAGDRFSNLFSAVFGCHNSLQSGQHFPMAVIGETSYSLICEYVIFIACQPWDGPDGSSVKALIKGLSATLNFCQVKNLHSVAMSVIGPGAKLCFPPEAAAHIIGEVVKSFVEKEPNTCVKRIEFVIPTENENLYYVCREKLLEMNLGDQIQLCNNDGDTFPKLSKGEQTEAKIGDLSVVVTYTDITKESTDVIVNSTNFSYWDKDTVAHAIFSAAGANIIRAAQHGASREKVVMTEAGSGDLKCKYIMHCNCKQDLVNIYALVQEILLKCENVGLHSVAIPAIGTGACKLDPGIVAHHMMDCILTLTRTRNLTSLSSVHLVTFHPSIYYIFCAELKKLSSPVQELFWNPLDLLTSRLKYHWLPENEGIKDLPALRQPLLPPTTQLVVVTDKKDKVNEIKCSLLKGFENAVKYREEKIEQSLLQTFSVEEIEMIFSVLNDDTDVGMILDRLNNCIIIEGCEQDVIEVAMKVHTNLMTVVTARLQMVTKERAGLLVQWGYSDGTDSNPFTVEASQLLEDSYLAGKRDVVIVKLGNGVKAVVNLQTMKAVLDEAIKRKVKVLRRDLKEETQCPLHWDSMNALLMLVELDPHSEEYETVKSNFNKTVNCLIKKIERIQNTYQYTAYILRKRYITEKNGPSNVNEKNLFHGTAPQNCHSINYSGFNRSFAGHNAASFGNGVYFAENASYSANQTYSPPDPNTGERFIYQVKVLVGRHTKGQQGMKHPPSRTENDPFDYYDSLTDKDTNPSMFVVFHDDQAYPEYLITFT